MSEAYTTIECAQTGTSGATATTDQLVMDINKLYQIMYQVGISQDELDSAIQTMLQGSNSDSTDSWTSSSMLDMIVVLIQDANCVYGGLCFIAGLMNVTTDLTNEVTTGQNAFMSMCDNTDTVGYNPTKDEQTLHDSLSVFNETTFTINYADGSTGSVNGVLNLLSNGSLTGSTTSYWGDTGKSPMNASSAMAIDGSVEAIEKMFTHWSDPTTYFTDIKSWSTSETDTYGIQTTKPQISDINNLFGQMDSQLETNYTQEGNMMNYGMTFVQQIQSATEEAIQTSISETMYIVQHSA